MICELCGAKVKKLYKVYIEGSILNVCEKCKKYGKPVDERGNIIEKTNLNKDLKISEETIDPNYYKILREYRIKNNLKQEDVAKLLNIKESLYKSIEEGKIIPNIDLAKKIEKVLKIKIINKELLLDKEETKNLGLTVGDIIELDIDDKGRNKDTRDRWWIFW